MGRVTPHISYQKQIPFNEERSSTMKTDNKRFLGFLAASALLVAGMPLAAYAEPTHESDDIVWSESYGMLSNPLFIVQKSPQEKVMDYPRVFNQTQLYSNSGPMRVWV